MPLNPDDIQLLKEPFGVLVHDKYVTKHKIKSILNGAKKLVCVGDCTTDRMISFGIVPDILVVDGIERRQNRGQSLHSKIKTVRELYCSNPAGSVSKEALFVLRQALTMSGPVKVVVDGEEDMLALPIISIAQQKTVVLYGQPLEGIVVVNVSPKMQRKAKNLMDRIGLK